MDVQNFRLIQNYKHKENELHQILRRQNSILQSLRTEYEKIQKSKEKRRKSTAEKLEHKRKLSNIYTFKLPESKQKSIKPPERYRYGWYQRPLTDLPKHAQELYKQRNQMIQLGNSFSKNNQIHPLTAIRTKPRATSAKNTTEMKYEMLNRAKQLGNRYSFLYRQKKPIKMLEKKSTYYRKYDDLLKQKNEIERNFGGTADKLPLKVLNKYLKTMSEIRHLEELMDLRGKQKSQEESKPQRTQIPVNQVIDRRENTKILEAANAAQDVMSKIYNDVDENLKEVEIEEFESATICQILKKRATECENSSDKKTNSQLNTSKISQALKGICNLFIDDVSSPYRPRLYPSLEDVKMTEISYPIKEKDDCQVSQDKCKLESILTSKSIDLTLQDETADPTKISHALPSTNHALGIMNVQEMMIK